ncbi:epimerase, partial [Streptomyces sp. SID7982]|nr:epimerase [Streptomyces sp. SID7982]
SAVEKAYGLTPTLLETALDATLAWYGEFLAARR